MIRAFIAACAAALTFSFALPAQQTSSVTATVRNERGDSIPFARVHAVAGSTDVTVSANQRGQLTIKLPFGSTHFTVTSLGHEALERDLVIDRANYLAEFILTKLAQQLSGVDVRAAWIGVRGGIGDEATREPIAGAIVTLSSGYRSVITDSAGRFEFPMPSAQDVVLQIERDGYQMRPARVDVLNDRPTDVVFFLRPGTSPKGTKNRLIDLNHRMAANELFSFTAGRDEILGAKALTLYDAIISSGLLSKKHMTLGKSICLFVNGLPRAGFPVTSIQAADIDFIEVYGQKSDAARSLMTEWPRGIPCYSNTQFVPALSSGTGRNFVAVVSVWTRR